jgi:hypothetical protein
VLVSLGPNAALTPAPGSDEALNLAGDPVFVHRDPSMGGDAAFDDVLHWVPIHLVVNRLIVAGRLP